MGNGVGVAFGARPGAEESSMMKPRLQTKSKAGVSQNGEGIECRAERNDPVEAYRRMELKGASLSSAARGEVRWEPGFRGGLSPGKRRRWTRREAGMLEDWPTRAVGDGVNVVRTEAA